MTTITVTAQSTILQGAESFTIGNDKYEYLQEENGNFFYGKLIKVTARSRYGFKQEYYYRFASRERRAEHFESHTNRLQRNHDEKTESKQRAVRLKQEFKKNPSIKIGDIFYDSWGYEQTNIDYYEVVAVKGLSVHFRRITGHVTESSFMSGPKVANKGDFKDEEVHKKMVRFDYNGEPRFKSSCGSISRASAEQLKNGITCSWYA